MENFNMPIENYKGYGKISSFRYVDETDLKKHKTVKVIEIRRVGSFDYFRIYDKRITREHYAQESYLTFADREEINILIKLAPDEVQEIFNLISYDKKVLALFNEYLKDLSKSKEGLKENVEEVKPKEKLSDKIIKEIIVDRHSKSGFDLFCCLESSKEKIVYIVVDEEKEVIFKCNYKIENGKKTPELLMIKNLTDEQIEYIKYYIKDNKEAMEVFNEVVEELNKEKKHKI